MLGKLSSENVGEKKQGKKKSKNPGRGNSINKGQVMGIGMFKAVSMSIKNVDVFMKEIQLRDIKQKIVYEILVSKMSF